MISSMKGNLKIVKAAQSPERSSPSEQEQQWERGLPTTALKW